MGEIRIIGGSCRGRRLQVPELPGLRPTPDRVRETLFNWLQGRVAGTRVLDLCAGSGALGLEALSRGAAWADLVEAAPQAAAALREATSRLNLATHAAVQPCTAEAFLCQHPPAPYDLVFVDPPYATRLLPTLLAALVRPGWLAAEAMVYFEHPAGEEVTLPAGLSRHRSARAGQVHYHLATAATSEPRCSP